MEANSAQVLLRHDARGAKVSIGLLAAAQIAVVADQWRSAKKLMRIVRCQPALDQQHQRLFAQQRPVEGLWQQAVGMQAHRRIAS